MLYPHVINCMNKSVYCIRDITDANLLFREFYTHYAARQTRATDPPELRRLILYGLLYGLHVLQLLRPDINEYVIIPADSHVTYTRIKAQRLEFSVYVRHLANLVKLNSVLLRTLTRVHHTERSCVVVYIILHHHQCYEEFAESGV